MYKIVDSQEVLKATPNSPLYTLFLSPSQFTTFYIFLLPLELLKMEELQVKLGFPLFPFVLVLS